jgi:hypothetical protein
LELFFESADATEVENRHKSPLSRLRVPNGQQKTASHCFHFYS